MRICSAILIFLSTGINLNAQLEQIEEFNNILLRTRSSKSRFLEYKDIEGHPYSTEELIPGSIFFVSGNHVDNLPMRYNWYSNDMEFEYQGEVLALPRTQDIDYISIDGKKYVPFYYLKNMNGYMIELCKGYYSLFRREDVRFIEAKPPQSGYDEYQPAKFQWFRQQYIVISSEGEIIELDLNKKKLPLQFPGLTEKIEKYIKENKPDLKNEEDLIPLFEMINSTL